MNEEQLIEFINWLPTAVPEFQDASPEQIVQTLNQLYESEEGQATLSQLFTAFQESKNEPQSQMFKKGGKLDQLVNKAKKGKKMCCKKKEIVQGGMANKIIEKAQDGSKLTRRQALDYGMTNQGYSRSHARTALANAMNTGRELGMRGKELRQWARRGVAAIPDAPDIDIFSDISLPEEELTVPVGRFIFTKKQQNPTVELMQNPQTFAQAFASARKEGLDEFTWRGNKYNTLTKEEAAALPMVDSRYSDALYRDFWNKKFPSNYVEKQQQGGMANKVAEKMQNGDKMPPKSINSLLFPDMNYDYSNLTKPFDENGNIVDTTQSNNPNIFQRFKNWWQRNTQPTITTEPARSPEQIDSLLNAPRPSFFGSPRRKQTTPVLTAQEGGEFDNPLVRNATLSTLDILDSTRPFIQQNVTPNETREFYAYSRDRLPDNVGGTGNFAGAIRTITPRDTTISYQLPGLAIYTAASSKDRGSRWKEMNSKMDSIKNKANNQKNK